MYVILSYFCFQTILEALMKYKLKNKTLPTSIIVYRDGVGEGQLSYVHNIEIKLFKVNLL